MWIWCRCSDCRNPGDARYSGKLAAMGTGDMDRRYGSPLSRILVKLCACLGFVECRACLCSFHSMQTVTDQLLHSWTASNASFLSPNQLLWCGDLTPASAPPPPGAGLALLTLFFFLSFLHPTQFCVDLYIPFCWLEASSWVMWATEIYAEEWRDPTYKLEVLLSCFVARKRGPGEDAKDTLWARKDEIL